MIAAGRRNRVDLHTAKVLTRPTTTRTRYKKRRRRLLAEIRMMCYAVAVTTGRVGRNGLGDADLIQARGWTSQDKSLTTHLPALSQAHSEATEENSCSYSVSYSVSPSACVPNGG